MFLAALNFGLHATSGLSPLADISSHLLRRPLILKLLVLVLPPELLEFLLAEVVRRVIGEVVRHTLELVRGCVLDLLLCIGVECLEGWLVLGTFFLRKDACGIAERGVCHG